MLLSLSSAMRGRGGGVNAAANGNGNDNTKAPASPPATTTAAAPATATTPQTPLADRGDVVVGETPEGAKGVGGSASTSSASTAAAVAVGERSSAAKKQRSIHDFFGSSSRRTPSNAAATATPSLAPRFGAGLVRRASTHSTSSSLQDSEEFVKKRIDYDDTSSMDDPDEAEDMMEEALSLSQNSEATATPQPLPVARRGLSSTASTSAVRPKRIDFGGICPSSQRSEPDVEPAHAPVSVVVTGAFTPGADSLVRSSSQSASQSYGGGYGAYGGYSAYGGGGMFSQDELDFCTPADQPVVHMSHPTTPSPMKKRSRRSFGDESDSHVVQEDVQNLTQDMTHMDVQRPVAAATNATLAPRVRGGAVRAAPLPSFSSSDSNDMLLATPQRVLGPPAGLPGRRRDAAPASLATPSGGGSTTPFAIAKGAPPPQQTAVESFTNPFAPVPAVDSRKRRKFRQSFPPAFGSAVSVPYSRYLSEFVEQELLGSGAFSKVFKCVKKIDGWTYAIKKSKRHLRGRADTERALREVQALAALSDSRHVVRYFDAWIEDDLLYIQLEHCASCSLATFVDAHKPLHVPEETLCKVLSHLAMALQDLHARHMVHMDVKLPNVLVAPGDVYKLGDLGTVARADGSMDITEGDNRYLSRELLEGSRANLPAGDVFALGATIYELALGATLPSGGEEWQKLRDGDLALFRQYTNSLQHLIASMMHPDPLQRPSAAEILQHEVVRPYVPR